MKKFLSICLVLSLTFILSGCQEASDLQNDAAESIGKLQDGVMGAKENVENTVNTVTDTVDTVTETVDKVKDAANSVGSLLGDE